MTVPRMTNKRCPAVIDSDCDAPREGSMAHTNFSRRMFLNIYGMIVRIPIVRNSPNDVSSFRNEGFVAAIVSLASLLMHVWV